ncbi:MAG TPA: hypothetical protein VFP69_14230, partial [Streptomyces sp.]|nr:hypothetical protein [Streptomyces sp.]
VFRSEVLDTWVIADGALARSVLTDVRFGTLTRAGGRHRAELLPPAGPDLAPSAPGAPGGPDGAGGSLAPRDEAALEALAEETARTLLGRLGPGFDLAADFARRVPARALAEFLGVPAADRGRFESLLTACARTLDSLLCPQTLDVTRTGLGAAAELHDLLTRHHTGSGARSPREALALAVTAAEPAAVLVCDAFEELGGAHGQGRWEALGRAPETADAAVLRTWWRRPPVRVESRFAQEDVVLAGVPVPVDGHVAVLAAAAQRDPAAAPPGIGHGEVRTGSTPPGAGYGPGTPPGALGTPLGTPLGLLGGEHATSAARAARALARAALRVLAREAPELRPGGPAVRLRRAPVTLGHARFPVTRTAPRPAAPAGPRPA